MILAGNHTGVFDGPLLYGTSPRPAHVVTKQEVFVGPVGSVLRGIGQIPINRLIIDFRAILSALRVLHDGRVLGLYPEGERGDGDFSRLKGGIAYLALRTGAPIVPVANFGVVRAGQNSSLPPRLRAPVDIVYGEPFTVEPAEPWGRYLPRHLVAEAREPVRSRLLDHLSYACEVTGHPVPESAQGRRFRAASPAELTPLEERAIRGLRDYKPYEVDGETARTEPDPHSRPQRRSETG